MNDQRRLIEVAFPLKQASLDSVHEKNVRHGHISTLHIWPARRPLAACRAALVATLLPDPGDPAKRQEILEKLGGKVVKVRKKKRMPNGQVEEVTVEETVGGILHWGRESGPDLEWFRQEIRKAYGGRAPRVLDPFAGGGAIPLEAMRLGCEATAVDINPVAWFILKCTLEYPQKLAGQTRPLPSFVLRDRAFVESFFKAQGLKGKVLKGRLEELGLGDGQEPTLPDMAPPVSLEADLAWHVRAWGWWVLQRAKADLAPYYPVVDGKPTVAYLWARTVTCKACRATIPLLKTRWLCKKDNKRVLLTMEPNADRTGVIFGIQNNVPVVGSNAAQRREHDKRIGAGTMSRSGVSCPCCGGITNLADLHFEGKAARLGTTMTAVVTDGEHGKEYRLPSDEELRIADDAKQLSSSGFPHVPFGLISEPITEDAKRNTWCVQFGIDAFNKLFTDRQLMALSVFLRWTRDIGSAAQSMGYSGDWTEALRAYAAVMLDRLVNQNSAVARWNIGGEKIEGTFARFALPVLWDFAETNPLADTSGGFPSAIEWVSLAVGHFSEAGKMAVTPRVFNASVLTGLPPELDLIVTDPPYYDAIGYAVLMDFFYVWLRRALSGLSAETDCAFASPLAAKWDSA